MDATPRRAPRPPAPRRERVGRVERAHRDHLSGPRADAGEVEQRFASGLDVAAAVGLEPAFDARLRDREEGAGAGARHADLRDAILTCGGDAHLLPDDDARRRLEAVERARHPQPGVAPQRRRVTATYNPLTARALAEVAGDGRPRNLEGT